MDQGDDNQPEFATIAEEIEYWKKLATHYLREKENVQQEFDDYTADSQQLEKEYEVTIEQHEKSIRDLTNAKTKAQNDVEMLKDKLDQAQRDVSNQQSQISMLQNEKIQMGHYIRELEQKNDDLERAQRVVAESVSAVETALNSAIERNAMLESEVDEKETLKEKLQRLMDETRDLKQEIQVKERAPDNERAMNGHASPKVDSNRLQIETETQTTPIKRDMNLNNDTPLTPSSRILALNIVGELLRKIGLSRFTCSQCGRPKCTQCSPTRPPSVHLESLEAKLNQSRVPRESGLPENNSRNRRLSKGTSSPSVQGYLH